jgi:hypothetical protein
MDDMSVNHCNCPVEGVPVPNFRTAKRVGYGLKAAPFATSLSHGISHIITAAGTVSPRRSKKVPTRASGKIARENNRIEKVAHVH